MILCLDVGNSHIFGGVFDSTNLKLRFRHATTTNYTSDQLGVFLKNVLRENTLDYKQIKKIAISSVVPPLDYSLRAACIKYFEVDPLFVNSTITTDLKIQTYNPHEVGADLIATSIAALKEFPQKNLIIISMGTATAFSVITKECEYLGASFLPGMKLSMEALHSNTAKLFPVEITKPKSVVGKNTAESIQSGLYFGQLGVIREITERITQEYFSDSPPLIIGTGGFSYLFETENIFTYIMPDLILEGLRLMLSRKT
jgi:type III pantothenate kinase